MVAQSKHGKPWQDDELDEIISDYFAMLQAELRGQKYVKARHCAALMERIERSHRSVEFKHQNISAVLDELGLPWIPGYIPKQNYQNSIFGAVDRYLSKNPETLYPERNSATAVHTSSVTFVDPPPPSLIDRKLPEGLKQLVRKFDPVERDFRNRSLGKDGEEFVLEVEKRRLIESDRTDLANRIRWVSQEDGDGAGFDILSFSLAGSERLIEVKTTNGAARTPFFLSRNECSVATERPNEWCLYRVHLFAKEPRIFTLKPPLEAAVRLRPETWRASF